MVWQICGPIMWDDEKRNAYSMSLSYQINQKMGFKLEEAKIRMAINLYQIVIYLFTNDEAEQRAFQLVVGEMRVLERMGPYDNILLIHKSDLGFRSNFSS